MPHAGADFDAFHAIADDTRRALLDRLRFGEERATALSEAFRISQPAVSQHLRVLRNAGLVDERREGRFRVYRLRPEPLQEVADWVGHYTQFWIANLQRLGDVLADVAPTASRRARRRSGSRRRQKARKP